MNKKILIGSILAVALLLLMPSIPAIQQQTIEDKAYSDFVEKFEDVDADFIELLKDVDIEDLQEKVEIFANSETFKHLTSSDRDDTFSVLFFILGLIIWIPVLIIFALVSIPMFFLKTFEFGLDYLPESPKIFEVIISFIIGFALAIHYLIIDIYLVAIFWPLLMAYYYEWPWTPPGE